MSAALRARDRVHLVEDQRLDGLQHLAPAGREQEVERLRGRDQDVRVLAEHRRAVALRCVAGADGDVELRAEPGERAAEVPLHVVVERLQRRDVEQPEPLARGVGEPVDPVQERGERLSGACRRLDQRVLAARDRRPALLLSRCRRGEGALEPGARARTEDVERTHGCSLAIGCGHADAFLIGLPHTRDVASKLLFIIAVLLVATTSAAGTAARVSSPFPSGWIVVPISPRGGIENAELFRIRADGTGLHQITHTASDESDPSFAPSGKRVVFLPDRPAGSSASESMGAGSAD